MDALLLPLLPWLVVASALASCGDDSRAHQRTSNAFFPGPPRGSGARAAETT